MKNVFVGTIVLAISFLVFPLPAHAGKAWIDVTSQYLNNPSFDGNSKDGWTATGYYSKQDVQYGCMEFWNGTFTLAQQLSSLPAGKYRLHVQGFFRTTGNDAAYQSHRNGSESITAYLYAGTAQKKLHSVYDEEFGANLANNCWAYGNWWEGYRYFPNGMASAHEAFSQDCYWNTVEFELTADQPVTVGIKNETAKNDNWCIFDNFRLEYYGDVSDPSADNLEINEVMAANIDMFWSPVTNFNGWAEVRNLSSAPVQLGGCYLDDGTAGSLRWRIPDDYAVVPAGGYALLWFDDNALSPRQVPFKLDTDGAKLCLYDPQGQLISSVSYPAAVTRTSYARSMENPTEWLLTGQPTPGTANQGLLPLSAQLPLPEISTESRIFSGTLTFTVTAPMGTTLRFTTDGSTPTLANGTTAPPQTENGHHRYDFSAINNTNYRFRLFKDGSLPSDVATRTFIKATNNYTVPVVSIVTDPDYLYGNTHGVFVKGTNGKPGRGQSQPCNWNMDWERPVSFTLLSPSGQFEFSQDVSLSTCGGWSRAWDPHSFKLKGNKVFGTSKTLDYPFFTQKPYIRNRTLQMRNGGNDNVCRFKDPALETMILRSGIDLDAQSYQPVVHYINGKYIGVINMREPNNKHFVFANRGWDDDEIDLFEMDADSGYVQKCGTPDSFNRLYNLSQHVNEEGVYNEICQMLDIDEYINYMAAMLYLGGDDWPQNNIKGYTRHDGRFRFVSFDQDFAFNQSDPFTTFFNKQNYTFAWLYDKQTQYRQEIRMVTLFKNLLNNDGFRRRFIDAFCIMGGSVFEASRAKAIIDELANAIAPMMKFENGSPWNTANDMKNRFSNWVSTVTSSLKRNSHFKLSSVTMQTARLSTSTPGATLFINDIEVPYADFNGRLFAPVTLRAEAPAGYTFSGWKNTSTGEIYSYEAETTMPTGNFSLTATFSPSPSLDREGWGGSPIVINEVSASNDSYVNDYYKRADWIELYNTTAEPVSLEGLYLSDDPSNPHKYRLQLPDPSQSSALSSQLAPFSHLIVWCDKKAPVSQPHTAFKLSDDGGELVVTAADDSWSSVIRYPAHDMDHTVARYPDGAATVYVTNVPTIGKRNVRTSYLVETEQEPNGITLHSLGEGQGVGLSVRYIVDRLIVESSAHAQGSILILDTAGRQVYATTSTMEQGRNEIIVPALPRGYYVAKVEAGGKRATCKMVVTK